jgi:hypothetical protein
VKHVEIMRWGRARALRAAVLRRAGLSYGEIAAALGGVCRERARQLVARGERCEASEARAAARKRDRDRCLRLIRLKPEFITPEDYVEPY